MKIVVTGSLGHISQPLAMALIENGHTVAVISSNPERQKDIEALGAIAAIGAVEDVAFLAAAFAGANAAYVMVPPNPAVPDSIAYYRGIGNNYAQAIEQAGVKRVVHLSSYGAHLDKGTGIILGSHHIEGILNALPGIALTHLRPGYFYYNLYHFAGMIRTAGFIGANYGGDDRLVMVAPADIAVAAAEELQTPVTGTTVRYVASDDRTASEVAAVIGAAIGKPDLPWLTFSDEQTLDALVKNGMPAAFAASYVELGASIHSGALRGDYDLHQPTVTGKVKLEDFAKEFAVAFNQV